MKKIKINYPQLLFLYAYLRMIDLSLDRSRWNSWSELQEYFKNTITPNQVGQHLINNFQLSTENLGDFTFLPKKKSRIDRLKSVLFKMIFLSKVEVFYCCKLLSDFKNILDFDNKSYSEEIENLRVNITKYYTEVLGDMISRKDLNRLMKIEHFEQSDKISVLELNEFIPDDFRVY